MADKICSICNNKIPFLEDIKVKDGSVCKKCIQTIGYRPGSSIDRGFFSACTISQLSQFLADRKDGKCKTIFNVTKLDKLYFDDLQEIVYYDGGILNKAKFKYAEIFDVGILDDSSAVQKLSVGNAVLGGAIAGPAGLVLGGLGCKKTKNVCSSLKVEIDLINKDPVFVTLLKTETKTKSFLYKNSIETAHKILSKIQQIMINNRSVEILEDTCDSSSNDVSVADEIAKYFDLFQAGALTEEEFEALKTKLMA